jgi:gluconokinase
MVVILMGVTGSGKTTVGRMLAGRLAWEFVDGDDFHSPANKQKMSRGIPLTDSDREPWLEALRSVVLAWLQRDSDGVLACSALKRSYREQLRAGEDVRFIYLKGDSGFLERRLRGRAGHFAGPDLLASQLERLEEPSESEAVTIPGALPPEVVVEQIISSLGLNQGAESKESHP